MCGIFGCSYSKKKNAEKMRAEETVRRLAVLSESRGSEAAGTAFVSEDSVHVYKRPETASRMVRSSGFKKFFRPLLPESPQSAFAVFGHSRLVTNGLQALPDNNQPVYANGVTGVHNGIVVNWKDILEKNPGIKMSAGLDSEVFFGLIAARIKSGSGLEAAVSEAFNAIEGSASAAFVPELSKSLVLATNTGSLFYLNKRGEEFLFASERIIPEKVSGLRFDPESPAEIKQIKAGSGIIVDIESGELKPFSINDPETGAPFISDSVKLRMIDSTMESKERRDRLKRCKKCLLPVTMPHISFDEKGVCNYCNEYKPVKLKGPKALAERIDKYKSGNGKECIVALSGGRDSSYGLHYFKNELGMKPVAYTYDWGMVNDLARRNQARMCGALGTEHILVSANIAKKRANVRRNLKAWMKRPELALMPLFTAGDKQFFSLVNRLGKEMRIPLTVWCRNPLEKTRFKTGFAGLKEREGEVYNLSVPDKLRLALYYSKQFILNPGYLNRSLADTAEVYLSAYFTKHDYLFLFDYIPWNEEEIVGTLKKEYNWETADDTETTWRIGDATAPFYNFVYLTVAGFTENDTLRSNQIREGQIDREEALEKVKRENGIRYDSIKWYCDIAGVNFSELVKKVEDIPKLY
ncbi:MAG: hypothetical protein ACLFQK_04020 [Fibrobacterota bacterium]